LQYSNAVVPPTSPNWNNSGSPTNGVTGTLELIDVGGALATDRFYQVVITIPE
jgi:hypothetical protein